MPLYKLLYINWALNMMFIMDMLRAEDVID